LLAIFDKYIPDKAGGKSKGIKERADDSVERLFFVYETKEVPLESLSSDN